MAFSEFTFTNEITNTNQLTINQRIGHIHGVLAGVTFIDKDTKQYVAYIPALEVSGYGETHDKAQEMIKSLIDDLFMHFMKLSPNQLEAEMKLYGFTKKIFNKQFSNPGVDIETSLKDFNIEENSIHRITLKTAA